MFYVESANEDATSTWRCDISQVVVCLITGSHKHNYIHKLWSHVHISHIIILVRLNLQTQDCPSVWFQVFPKLLPPRRGLHPIQNHWLGRGPRRHASCASRGTSPATAACTTSIVAQEKMCWHGTVLRGFVILLHVEVMLRSEMKLKLFVHPYPLGSTWPVVVSGMGWKLVKL